MIIFEKEGDGPIVERSSLPSLEAATEISFDVETYDPELKTRGPGVRRDGRLIGASFAVRGRAWYVPLGHPETDNVPMETFARWAGEELGRGAQPKNGANLLYDMDYLAHVGVAVRGKLRDVQVAEPLLDENKRGRYDLDSLGEDYLNVGKDVSAIEEICRFNGWKGAPQKHLWRMPGSAVAGYAIDDAWKPLAIFDEQEKRLREEELEELFDLESRLIPMLLAMRRRGVRVDSSRAEEMGSSLKARLEEVEAAIRSIAGRHVDIWAARSIAAALDDLGIPYPRTEKKNEPSITQSYLDRLDHPIGEAIRSARQLDKLRGTFVEGQILENLIDGRLHCQFNQLKSDDGGTVTGRFSSSNPNLQFIPIRTEEGRLIRTLFTAEAEHEWVKQDYSQIELRILAHYAIGSGADDLRRMYIDKPDTDLHAWCADIAGISRKAAKTINFGLVYGMGLVKLAASLALAQDEASKFLTGYHESLPFLKSTVRKAAEVASRRGYVKTILGRRRRFPLWEPADFNLARAVTATRSKQAMIDLVEERRKKSLAEGRPPSRQGVQRAGTFKAFNAVDQGSAADLMKKSMVDIWESGVCDVLGAPLLTVHDELDWEKPKTRAGGEAIAEAQRLMETAIPMRVPIVVETTSGSNWGECA